jgi:hypothetical protein
LNFIPVSSGITTLIKLLQGVCTIRCKGEGYAVGSMKSKCCLAMISTKL